MFNANTYEILQNLENTAQEFWNVDRQSANFLNMLVKALNIQNALELGTSNGYSAIWIAQALKQTGGRLTTIEFWDKRLNVAVENFKACAVDTIITPKLGSACDILASMQDERFDFVFMDANKLEYIKYFELIHPILKPGGVILADNITSHSKKVEPYLNEILNHPQYQSELLKFPDGILMSLKLP